MGQGQRLRRRRYGAAGKIDRPDRAHLRLQEPAEGRRHLHQSVPAAGGRTEAVNALPSPRTGGARERYPVTSSVDIADVTLTYHGASGGVLALQGTTLNVGRGEFAAVVGPS